MADRKRRTPQQFEADARSLIRMVALVVGFLIVAVLALAGPPHKPAPAPCPPAECQLHPHAPHGPTP
jgi:hypothetical protein